MCSCKVESTLFFLFVLTSSGGCFDQLNGNKFIQPGPNLETTAANVCFTKQTRGVS